MIISTKYTHADLLVMPNDGKRREIIDGELYVTPSPNLRHQRISRRIEYAILKYLETHPVGEVFVAPLDVIFGERDVTEPDLLLVLRQNRAVLQDWVRGAPDLVVEILSPSTAAVDRGPKLKTYARFGVREYWIVDPDSSSIEVYRASAEGYALAETLRLGQRLTTPLLPGFEIPLDDIFSD